MGAAELSDGAGVRPRICRTDPLVIESRIVPLADADADRRDRQLRAIVNLLRGARRRAAGMRPDTGDTR